MAVQSDTSRIQYAGNNSTTTSYAVPFVFQDNAHLKAIARTSAGVESVVTLTNHTGAADPNGGTVRTAVAVPATSTLTIYREVPATQTTTYAEGGDFPAASHERALDKLTFLVQQLARSVARCVRLTDAAPESSAISVVANQFFGTDSNGAIAMVAGVNAAPESITNASISPTAAIAGTKISPDFGSQNVTTTERAGIGAASNTSSRLTVHSSTTPSSSTYSLWLKGGSAGQVGDGGNIAFSTASESTIATSNLAAAAIRSMNVWGSEANGESADLAFFTNQRTGANTYTGLTERMRINASGNVGIGTNLPSSRLHIAGDVTVSSATTATTATTTTGGSTLPALAAGYIVVSINGTSRKIPFYAT